MNTISIGQAQGLGYYQERVTVDKAITTLRQRAEELRGNLASVDRWREELAKLEAVLKAWGDK